MPSESGQRKSSIVTGFYCICPFLFLPMPLKLRAFFSLRSECYLFVPISRIHAICLKKNGQIAVAVAAYTHALLKYLIYLILLSVCVLLKVKVTPKALMKIALFSFWNFSISKIVFACHFNFGWSFCLLEYQANENYKAKCEFIVMVFINTQLNKKYVGYYEKH